MQPVETDLGEYICQLAEEPPSHIIAPVIHKTKADIAELFARKHKRPQLAEVEAMTREAREMLRAHFLSADLGISGGNFLIAETGSLALVTNEGNGRMVTTLPRVHVAITGIEKIVPTLEDLSTLMRLLPRSATGQSISNYFTLAHRTARQRRPRRAGAHVFHSGGQRPHQSRGQRHAGDAALHPLRRVHEPLPGVPERRRACLRLGLSRARWARC